MAAIHRTRRRASAGGPDETMEAQDTAVEPLTRDHAEALLEGNDAFTRRFGYRVADGYLAFPRPSPRLSRRFGTVWTPTGSAT
jgi:hypothetical protein